MQPEYGSRAVEAAVFCGLATTRMRTAVSLMRTRTTLLRTRTRTTVVGSNSKVNNNRRPLTWHGIVTTTLRGVRASAKA